jgi:hypothetical protein
MDAPFPDLAVVAEGALPTGEHWTITAGGTRSDYYTMLKTVHPDGHSDEGGMGGPPLYTGSQLNTYTGMADQGLQRLLVRAGRGIQQLRLKLSTGESRDLLPAGADDAVGLTFFATLLPRNVTVTQVSALGPGGEVVEEVPPRYPPPPPAPALVRK